MTQIKTLEKIKQWLMRYYQYMLFHFTFSI